MYVGVNVNTELTWLSKLTYCQLSTQPMPVLRIAGTDSSWLGTAGDTVKLASMKAFQATLMMTSLLRFFEVEPC